MRFLNRGKAIWSTTLILGVSLLAWGSDSIPGLKLKNLDGLSQSLKQYKGKPLVVNFWATWCGPCQEEMPLFVAEEQAYRGRGVIFIGVSMDDGQSLDKVRAFVNKLNVTYPILMGSADDLDRFKLGPGIPATAFVNPDGEIVGRVLGEIHKPDLEQRLEWLLGKRQGEAPIELENNLNIKH